jgi:hypothetical protein
LAAGETRRPSATAFLQRVGSLIDPRLLADAQIRALTAKCVLGHSTVIEPALCLSTKYAGDRESRVPLARCLLFCFGRVERIYEKFLSFENRFSRSVKTQAGRQEADRRGNGPALPGITAAARAAHQCAGCSRQRLMNHIRQRISRPLYLMTVFLAMSAWLWGLAAGLQRLF